MSDWQPDIDLAEAMQARHAATHYPTHCDACYQRWPCDIRRLADDMLQLVKECRKRTAGTTEQREGSK